MPRVQTLTFTADYQTVAEAMKGMLKNAVVTEGEWAGSPMITVEGDFERFILADMEMWREHIKLEIQDGRIKDEDDREARAFLAQHTPGLAGALFSPTIAHVYKRVEKVVRTKTITQHLHDGNVASESEAQEDSDSQADWVEITGEFGSKVVKPGEK